MPHFDKEKTVLFVILAAIAIVSICKIISVANNQNKVAKLQEETVNEYVTQTTDEVAAEDVVETEEIVIYV